MDRRVVPKERIGSSYGDMGMSMRRRHVKGIYKTLNAADRSAYGDMSVSLCGIGMEKKENKKEKEVVKETEKGMKDPVKNGMNPFHGARGKDRSKDERN